MFRTLQNVLMALLLIAALGSRCVLACAGPAEAQKSTADPHACCKKGAGHAKTQVPSSDCQGQTFEVAKVTTHVAPPLVDSVSNIATMPVPLLTDSPRFEVFIYSPPDLIVLHQVFLI